MIAEQAAAQSAPPATDAAQVQQKLLATAARMEDRVEVIDALYRFAAGQDLRDPALFSSAFAPSAVLDFVQPAKKLGVDLPVFKGRDNIVSSIRAALAEIDTTHTVTTREWISTETKPRCSRWSRRSTFPGATTAATFCLRTFTGSLSNELGSDGS